MQAHHLFTDQLNVKINRAIEIHSEKRGFYKYEVENF